MKDHLRLIVNEPIATNDIKPFQDLKKLNKACLNLNAIEDVGLQHVLDYVIVNQMGGWPVLLTTGWNDTGVSWTRTMAKAREHGFSVNTIFSFSVSTDRQNSSRRIATVSYSVFELSDYFPFLSQFFDLQ